MYQAIQTHKAILSLSNMYSWQWKPEGRHCKHSESSKTQRWSFARSRSRNRKRDKEQEPSQVMAIEEANQSSAASHLYVEHDAHGMKESC